VSWDRLLEQRLAEAAAQGELDAPTLKGKPLPDIDRQRGDGWWADRFVQRELSHDRRVVAVGAATAARNACWRASSELEVRALVADANRAIARANVNLIESDQLPPFDPDDVVSRWRRLADDDVRRTGRGTG
jgi:hypothetical protein